MSVVGSFLIQTFCLFLGPVSHLHPLTPSSLPTTCRTDPSSTYSTRARVSNLLPCTCIKWKRMKFVFSLLSLFRPQITMAEDCYCKDGGHCTPILTPCLPSSSVFVVPFLSSGGRPKPSSEVCLGHCQRHGFPPHLRTNGFTALPQQ